MIIDGMSHTLMKPKSDLASNGEERGWLVKCQGSFVSFSGRQEELLFMGSGGKSFLKHQLSKRRFNLLFSNYSHDIVFNS